MNGSLRMTGRLTREGASVMKDMFKCPVTGCESIVSARLLMCIRHWSILPSDIRKEVHAGNREMKAGKSARRWVEARDRAIAYCVLKETL